MAEKTWKHTERKIADLLGGQRVPVTGRGRGDAPDIRHDWIAPEVKHRKLLPAWLLDALSQARASARNGQLPIAVLHPHNGRHSEDLVVMSLGDFIDHFGSISKLGEQTNER